MLYEWINYSWQSFQNKTIHSISTITSWISTPIRYWTQQASDSYRVITEKDQFIFNELTNRSLASKKGIAKVDIGLFGLRWSTVMVVTGKDYVIPASDYGNWKANNPKAYDPKARQPLDGFKAMMGVETVANQSDEGVLADRKRFKRHTNHQDTRDFCDRALKEVFEQWDPNQTINSQIKSFVTRLIGKVILGVEHVPLEINDIISKAEHAIIYPENTSKEEFASLSKRIKKINDDFIDTSFSKISKSSSYVTTLLGKPDIQVLKDMNPLSSLIVEANITSLFTGGLVLLYNHPEILKKLESSNGKKGAPMSPAQEQLLDNFYRECLRFMSPNPPTPRFVSKKSVLKSRAGDIPLSANTHIFIPTRAIMHAPKLWKNPGKFDPSRHEHKKAPNFYPLIPFSIGERICPASHSLAEYAFKAMIRRVIKTCDFKVDKPLEQIPVGSRSPRLQQNYFLNPGHDEINPLRKHLSNMNSKHKVELENANVRKVSKTDLINKEENIAERLDFSYKPFKTHSRMR